MALTGLLFVYVRASVDWSVDNSEIIEGIAKQFLEPESNNDHLVAHRPVVAVKKATQFSAAVLPSFCPPFFPFSTSVPFNSIKRTSARASFGGA